MRAALSTTSGVARQLRELAGSSRRLYGMSADDRNAMSDSLQSLAEEYIEGFEDEDVSDEDDL